MSVHTTVIIAVRNGERFLREAVDSVLGQLDDGDELLVVDDASTDGTRACVDGADPRIRVLEGRGRGVSAARNLALAAARGEFIAFLDHDDVWPPGRHARLLSALARQPGADVAVGRIRLRVEPDGRAGMWAALDGRQVPAVLQSCLFRHAIVARAGCFAEDLRYGEDLDFHLRMLEAGMKIAYCGGDSVVYRRHGGNTTNAAPPVGEQMLEIIARKLARERGKANLEG